MSSDPLEGGPASQPGSDQKSTNDNSANEGNANAEQKLADGDVNPVKGFPWKMLGVEAGSILFLWACLLDSHNIYALLSYFAALIIGYCAACYLLFEKIPRFRWALSVFVVVVLSISTSIPVYHNATNGSTPAVFPIRIQLADGTNVLGTKATIVNPSDADVYDVRVLLFIDTSAISVPVSSVQSTLEADNEQPAKVWDGKEALGFDFTIDYVSQSMQARFISVYRLRPHQRRDLWIQGSLPSKSYANLAVVAYEDAPLKIQFSPRGGYIWPLIFSNSPAWKYFPGVLPINIVIESVAWRGTNEFTNNSQIIPSHP